MKKILIISLLFIGLNTLYASDKHDHGAEEKHEHEAEEKHDHEEEGDHENHGEDEGHHDHGGGKAIGKNKAIVEVDENKGFKLSPEAIGTLKLKLMSIEAAEFKITKESLVVSKNQIGLYRFRDGFFKLVKVKIVKELNHKYLVKIDSFKFADQFVTKGIGLLRVSDVYSTDLSEYGHSH